MVKRMKKRDNNHTRNQQSGINLTLLPEIIFNILLRLTVLDLVKLKMVCKFWFDIISSREFASASLNYWKSKPEIIVVQRNHLGYYSACFIFETKRRYRLGLARYVNETVKIMSSLDGLMVFERKGPIRKIYICNPITRKFKFLFYIPTWAKYEVLLTLVFDNVPKQYKVLGFRSQSIQDVDDKYFVMTLNGEGKRRTRSGLGFPLWRNVEDQFQHAMRPDFSTIVIDGILYWVACTLTERVVYLQTMDLAKEVFGEKIPLPCQPTHWCWGTCRVLEMESTSSVYVVISCGKFELGIWVLKPGKDHEWIKQHNIILDFIVGTPTNVNNDYMIKVLVALDTGDSNHMKLVIQFRHSIYTYNFKERLMTLLPIHNYSSSNYVFVPSLLTLE